MQPAILTFILLCKSCGVHGETDEFTDTFICPECQGEMKLSEVRLSGDDSLIEVLLKQIIDSSERGDVASKRILAFLADSPNEHTRTAVGKALDQNKHQEPKSLSKQNNVIISFPSQNVLSVSSPRTIKPGNGHRTTNATSTTPVSTARASSGVERIIKRISILMSQGEWEEAKIICKDTLKSDPENAELYLLLCMIDHRVLDENGLREADFNQSEDKNFQVALRFASPERRKQLEKYQLDSFFFYFQKCMQENGFSKIEDLVNVKQPLSIDENFQRALEIAPPERKQELYRIQDEQAKIFLQQCLNNYHVAVYPIGWTVFLRLIGVNVLVCRPARGGAKPDRPYSSGGAGRVLRSPLDFV